MHFTKKTEHHRMHFTKKAERHHMHFTKKAEHHHLHFTKRALLYISRKKGKTASLFLLLFTIAIFLISCFGILHAAKMLSRDIRTSLGAAFYIRAGTDISVKENGETEVTENRIHLTREEIDKIMGMDEIKHCNPVNYGFAKSDSLHFLPGEKDTEENNMGKVTALSFSALAPDFVDGTAVLTEGRHLTEKDKRKILLSESLASANHLSVGDTITLTHAKLEEYGDTYVDTIPIKTAFVQVEICGLYQPNAPESSLKPTAGLADNELYASLDVLEGLSESEAGICTGEAGFYLADPAELSAVVQSVRKISTINWATHFVRTNDFQYARIADRLSSLGDLARILLVCVSTVSAAILTLLLLMRMRSRTQETGILLAAGIPKGQILGQYFFEVLGVAAAALFFSCAVSPGIAKVLGNSLFEGLQPHLLNEETLLAETNGGISASPIDACLQLSKADIALICLGELLVTAASTLLSSAVLMRLAPKDVLSRMS